MFQVTSYYLENGIKVYLHKLPNIRILTVGVIIHHGSLNEDDESNGISHFIEHLILNKNTDNKNMLSKFDELLKYGATYNAETTKDSTFFYISGLNNGIDVYFDLLKESLFNNRSYSNELFINEKKIINQEYDSYVSSFKQIQERTIQALYGNTGLGRLILGKKENISSFTRDEVVEKILNIYTPENTSIMIIGDFDQDIISEKVSDTFNQILDINTIKTYEKISSSPGVYHNPSYVGDNCIMSMGFRYYDKEMTDDYYTVMKYILNAMCNFTISNRIIHQLREKSGLVYSVNGFVQNNLDFCSLGIHAVFNHENMEKVSRIMINEVNRLRENGFENDEFELIKSNLITNRLKEKVNLDDQVYYFSKAIKNSKIYSPENDLRIIKNMKLNEANNMIVKILDMNNLGIALLGKSDIDLIIRLI